MEEKTKPQARTRDLGKGSIPKLLAQLAIPVVVAQIVNLLYNIVDRIYIGHIPGIGAAALTGVGLFAPILMLINAFAMLSGSGGAPRAAIFMGRKDNETAEKIMANCFSLILIFAVGLTILFSVFAPKLLRLFGASDATLPYAVEYARIYIFGSIFVLIVLGMNLFITTQGFAKISMKTVLIGAICNIILDPLFIFAFHMGVKGAAVATILSQAVSAVWVFSFLNGKQTKLRIRKEYLKVQPQIILPVMGLGLASFVMNITESLINIAFNASLSKYGGDVAVGAMTILASIMQLQFMPVQGLGQGAQPLISYNYGAAKVDRVKKTIRILIVVSLIYTMAFWLFVECFPGVFVQLFNSSSPELYEMTTWAARIYMGMTGIFGIQMAIQQTFMSLGQAKLSLFIACLRKIILLLPLIYLMPMFIENKVFAVFLAEPVSDFISVAVASTLFLCNIKKILAKA